MHVTLKPAELKTMYVCDICGKEYHWKFSAEQCEKAHVCKIKYHTHSNENQFEIPKKATCSCAIPHQFVSELYPSRCLNCGKLIRKDKN